MVVTASDIAGVVTFVILGLLCAVWYWRKKGWL